MTDHIIHLAQTVSGLRNNRQMRRCARLSAMSRGRLSAVSSTLCEERRLI